MNEKIKKFEEKLKQADWTYMYSNDRNIYDAGKNEMDTLCAIRENLCKEFPEMAEEIKDLFLQYRTGQK